MNMHKSIRSDHIADNLFDPFMCCGEETLSVVARENCQAKGNFLSEEGRCRSNWKADVRENKHDQQSEGE